MIFLFVFCVLGFLDFVLFGCFVFVVYFGFGRSYQLCRRYRLIFPIDSSMNRCAFQKKPTRVTRVLHHRLRSCITDLTHAICGLSFAAFRTQS